MPQFSPLASSLGTVDGKVSDSEEVVTVDMFKQINDERNDSFFTSEAGILELG